MRVWEEMNNIRYYEQLNKIKSIITNYGNSLNMLFKRMCYKTQVFKNNYSTFFVKINTFCIDVFFLYTFLRKNNKGESYDY